MMNRKLMLAEALGLAMILTSPAWAQTEDIYISASGSGTARNADMTKVRFADEDILLCDRSGGPGTCIWTLFFDGSDEGLSRAVDLTAFHVEDDNHILMAFKTPKKIGNLKKVDDSDIVHFDRTAHPSSAFSLFFDGSDVGLTTDDESIDAIGFDASGRLVISTDGNYSVPKTGGGTLSGGDEDLLVFIGTTGSSNTIGDWELFFDGSAVGLNSPQEDVWGAWIDSHTGEVYLTTRGDFSVGSLTGGGTDIFICDPIPPLTIGEPIIGCHDVSIFFDDSNEGFDDKTIDGIFIFNNTPPTDIALDNTSVDENQPVGTAVGTLTTVDPDPLDTHTYSLVAGAGDTDNASFAIVGDQLQTAAVLNFEAMDSCTTSVNTCSVRIQTDDGNGGTHQESFIIDIGDLNDDPTDIALDSQDVDENEPAGTAVGTFATTDEDTADTHTYTLVAGAGNTDNAQFTIVGDELQTNAVLNFEAADNCTTSASTCSIRVETDDGNGGLFEKNFIIDINDANDDPTDIALDNASVDENQPSGTAVGTFTSTDEDPSDTHSYTLVAGAGNTDNAAFTIVGDQLQTVAVLNFEAADNCTTSVNTCSIRVETDDGNGGMFEKTFIISISDVNDDPSDIALDNSDVDENVPSGTVVGNFSTVDEDPTDTHTYTLAVGAGDTDNASFAIVVGQLQTAAVFDYDTQNSFSIRVQTDDGNGGMYEEVLTITVNKVNTAPTDIVLDNASVNENQLAGTTVGTFTTTDGNASDTHTYTLVAGTGNTDNAAFAIAGDQLQTAAVLNFEAMDSCVTSVNTCSIRVETDDGNGGMFEKSFIINIGDINDAPTDIALDNSDVVENEPVGTVVGNFSTTDEDATDTHTYTLVSGAGDTGNASFSISSGQLLTAAVLDESVLNSYSIRVQTSDGAGGLFEEVFTITVLPDNFAPTDIALSNNSVDENQPAGTTVGMFTTTDVDPDTHTYTLVDGAGNTDNVQFTIVGDLLKTATVLNFEAADNCITSASTCSIRVQTDDGNGGTFQESFIINIGDLNDDPTDIALDSQDVDENEPAGTAVGTLATTDEDTADTHTYTLVAGAGDTDNTQFTIVGDELQTDAVLNFEAADNCTTSASTCSIRVQTDDGNGGMFQESFIIGINDVNDAPVATDQAFNATGNVRISVLAASGLLIGASDPDGDGVTVNGVSGESPGAIVTFNANGSFTYTPPPGFNGDDTFSYTLIDDGVGPLVSDPATVTVTVNDVIWFIDNTAAAGDGRLNTPFNTLADFETVNGNGSATDPAAGDDIFVYTGVGSYSGGVTLENNQQLIGQGTTDTSLADALGISLAPNSDPLPPINGTRPELGPTGTAVALASGNTVRGLDISVTGASQGLVGTGFGSATIDEMAITTVTGTALNLDNGNASATFDSITSTGAGGNSAIVLSETGADAITVNGGTIANKSTDAITFNDTDGPITLANMIIEDIGDASDTTDALNTRSGQDGIHGQTVSGGLTLDGVTIRRISDNCVNGSLLSNGFSATTWNGLEISNSLIENCNRYHVSGKGDSSAEGAVRIVGIIGTVLVENSTLQFAAELLDFFTHTSGTLDMTVQGSVFNRTIKEFPTGGTVNTGLHGIDVTFEGAADGVIRIGDPAQTTPALGNIFTDNAVGSIRIAQDAGATGDVDVVISQNIFEILDHLTSQQSPGNFIFNIPQGGVLLWARGGTFEAIVSNNLFDQVMHANGGLGQLTLLGDDGSDSEFIVQGNTFDLPWDAPVRILADANTSMAVKFGGTGAGEPNTYIDGLLPGNLADDLGNGCSPGYLSPFTPWHLNVRNNGALDLTVQNEILPQHDDGSSPCFPSGSGFTNSFDASINATGGTLMLGITGSDSPDGYNLAQGGGVFNLYATTGCGGSPTPQAILNANSNRGGGGTYLINGDTTTPPVVATSGTITCSTTAPTLPSITIP